MNLKIRSEKSFVFIIVFVLSYRPMSEAKIAKYCACIPISRGGVFYFSPRPFFDILKNHVLYCMKNKFCVYSKKSPVFIVIYCQSIF
jgi:hypothetical protein